MNGSAASSNPFATSDLTDVQISQDYSARQSNGHENFKSTGRGDGLDANMAPLEVESQETSGSATWPQAACHTVTAVVGAGVLGLPYSFSYLGWAVGLIFLIIASSSSLYTSYQLASLHEQDGKRIDRYRDLGVHTFGPLWGRLAITPFQTLVMVGLAAVYTVTGAKSMAVLEDLSKDEDSGASITKYTFVFGAVQLLLSQIPDFAHLWWVSIVGAAMSLGYSLLSGALAIAAAQARDGGADYGKRGSGAEFWRGVFTSLGAITFAYGGHSVLLEIQATLRVPPSAKVSMMKGVYSAYVVSGVCYLFVSICGYASYGNDVDEDVLLSRPRQGKAWIGIANMMVWLHVVASFQVFTQPIYEALETSLTTRWAKLERHILWLRIVWRSLYVIIITLIAAAFPFFTDLMGLIGALGFIPMTFVMPCIIWLVVRRGQLGKVQLFANWFIIVVFTLVAFSAFVASAASIAIKKRHGQLILWDT